MTNLLLYIQPPTPHCAQGMFGVNYYLCCIVYLPVTTMQTRYLAGCDFYSCHYVVISPSSLQDVYKYKLTTLVATRQNIIKLWSKGEIFYYYYSLHACTNAHTWTWLHTWWPVYGSWCCCWLDIKSNVITSIGHAISKCTTCIGIAFILRLGLDGETWFLP